MACEALDLAKYIVSKCAREGHPVSNLQLQKILYYIQKEFLDRDTTAFDDEIEAWPFGPVVPEVYYHFCGFGAMPITAKYDPVPIPECCALVNSIITEKRGLEPWVLVEDVHAQGKPWDQIFNSKEGGWRTIPKDLIKMCG